MKAALFLCVLSAVIVFVMAATFQSQIPGYPEYTVEESSQNAVATKSHGSRTKRSPLDPLLAPLLIGKSFLYGALIGPKLFRPCYHCGPKVYYHRPHGHGWGWGK